MTSRQTTGLYLLGLAAGHVAQLATFTTIPAGAIVGGESAITVLPAKSGAKG